MPCSFTASPIISPTGSLGDSEEYGSWKIICIFVLSALDSFAVRFPMSCPSNMILPSVLGISPRIVLPVVDLPQPDSPTSPIVVPLFMEKDTSSTALTFPVTPPKKPPFIGKYFFKLETSRMLS